MKDLKIHNIYPHAYLMYIDDISEENLALYLDELPKWRADQANAFKHLQGRIECTMSYLLLREALANEFAINENVTFDYLPKGKPVLKEYPDIHFNISHCRFAVACVVDRNPVGIDVERIGRYNEKLGHHVLNDNELDELNKAEDIERCFTSFWTKKEAVLKLTGEGIDTDMKDVISHHTNIRTHTDGDERVVWTVAWWE